MNPINIEGVAIFISDKVDFRLKSVRRDKEVYFLLIKGAIQVLDPRWQLEDRRRQCELCKSIILLRCWSRIWQKKNTKKNQNSNTLNFHSV
jgi:hypothetical protein